MSKWQKKKHSTNSTTKNTLYIIGKCFFFCHLLIQPFESTTYILFEKPYIFNSTNSTTKITLYIIGKCFFFCLLLIQPFESTTYILFEKSYISNSTNSTTKNAI